MPPLRARKLDVARLVARELAAQAPRVVAHARLVEACCVRPWPGNVRELLGAVRLAASTARAAGRDLVRAEDLPPDAGLPITGAGAAAGAATAVTAATVPPASVDKAALADALARANGVVSVAARALGLHRTQLYRLMDKYGLAREPGDGDD